MGELQQRTASLVDAGYEQRRRAQHSSGPSKPLAPGHETADAGKVVGKLATGAPVLAKSVDAARLSIPREPPEFDPTSLFDEPHRTVYTDPVSQAADHVASDLIPPKVRVHASWDQSLRFIQFLDEHHRLELVPAEKVRESRLCGPFGLVKDAAADRLIVDARAANQLEPTLNSWTRTMGSIQ